MVIGELFVMISGISRTLKSYVVLLVMNGLFLHHNLLHLAKATVTYG